MDKGDAAGDDREALLPSASNDVHVQHQQRPPSERLVSLDMVRGFTVAVMIFVDDLGDDWPPINHSPWNGITLADIVMPWFLFMVGMAMAISLRKFEKDTGILRANARCATTTVLGGISG